MSDKTAAQKGHVKPGTRIAVLHGVDGVIGSLGLVDPVFVDPEEAELLFVFVGTRAELDARFDAAFDQLAPGAMMWAFYKKGSKAAGHDMSRDDVWYAAEKRGMRPLGLLGVDDTWSVFRLKQG